MGKKDEYQFDYLDDNERFADQINGALFSGRQVVQPEELEPEDSRIVNAGPKQGTGSTETIVDKARIWRGRKLHIFVVENQNYVDYQMVLRNMFSESSGYRRQWKQKKRQHMTADSLKDKDEYLSGMKREEKFAPIITLVVYFGTDHPWDGAKCLHDLLDIDDELKEYAEVTGAVEHGGFFDVDRDAFDVRPHDDHVEELETSRDDIDQKVVHQPKLGIHDIGRDDRTAKEGGQDQQKCDPSAAGQVALGECEGRHHAHANREEGPGHYAQEGRTERDLEGFVAEYVLIVLQRPHPGPQPERAARSVRACVEGQHQYVPERVHHHDAKQDQKDRIEYIKYAFATGPPDGVFPFGFHGSAGLQLSGFFHLRASFPRKRLYR